VSREGGLGIEMNQEPLHTGDGVSASAGLFVLGVAVFVVSLFCPVMEIMDETLHGWQAAQMTAWGSVSGTWYFVTRMAPVSFFELVPMFLGTFANVTFLTTALLGWKVRAWHAVPMLTLAVNGLIAGLVVPGVLFPGSWQPPSRIFEVYGDLQIGYWLWIVSLALIAGGWVMFVWQRRQMRLAQIAASRNAREQ
jgi:hypothetical protein